MTTAKPKATEKAPTKKPKASKKSAAAQKEPAAAPVEKPVFREIKGWSDCKDLKVRIWHPALGEGFHPAKVLNVDLTAGSVLVRIRDKSKDGKVSACQFLLPLDSIVAKVK